MQDYSSFKDDEKFNNLPKVKKAVQSSIIQTQAVGSKVLFIPLLYIVINEKKFNLTNNKKNIN